MKESEDSTDGLVNRTLEEGAESISNVVGRLSGQSPTTSDNNAATYDSENDENYSQDRDSQGDSEEPLYVDSEVKDADFEEVDEADQGDESYEHDEDSEELLTRRRVLGGLAGAAGISGLAYLGSQVERDGGSEELNYQQTTQGATGGTGAGNETSTETTTVEQETQFEDREPVEVPGPYEGKAVRVTDDELYEWSEEDYANIVNEATWKDVEEEPGSHQTYLDEDGTVIIVDEDDREWASYSPEVFDVDNGKNFGEFYDELTG